MISKETDVVKRAIYELNKRGHKKYFTIKSIKQVDGIWIPMELVMITKNGSLTTHASLLRKSSSLVNQSLSINSFRVSQLEMGIPK